jgi:protein-ribulosamine 3-kinase
MTLWQIISEHISSTTGRPFSPNARNSVGGGCINAAYSIEGSGQRYFVKINDAAHAAMFEAEAAGLQEIAAAQAIRVPLPICYGTAEDTCYLVLEYIDMGSGGNAAAQTLGRQLAALHRASAPRFGWSIANTIGATPQVNSWSDSWLDFWRERRLGYQLELAARNGFGGGLQRKGEQLLARVGSFFHGYAPVPSLLHGDLWGGNWAIDLDGSPVVFDPAVYYGDREADIAMTELFGGFPPSFYAAYREAWPLHQGYAVRKTLYNLYHVINHLNLFGGGYQRQAEQMMEQLLAEVRG